MRARNTPTTDGENLNLPPTPPRLRSPIGDNPNPTPQLAHQPLSGAAWSITLTRVVVLHNAEIILPTEPRHCPGEHREEVSAQGEVRCPNTRNRRKNPEYLTHLGVVKPRCTH